MKDVRHFKSIWRIVFYMGVRWGSHPVGSFPPKIVQSQERSPDRSELEKLDGALHGIMIKSRGNSLHTGHHIGLLDI